eukprot:gene9370-7052_t
MIDAGRAPGFRVDGYAIGDEQDIWVVVVQDEDGGVQHAVAGKEEQLRSRLRLREEAAGAHDRSTIRVRVALAAHLISSAQYGPAGEEGQKAVAAARAAAAAVPCRSADLLLSSALGTLGKVELRMGRSAAA